MGDAGLPAASAERVSAGEGEREGGGRGGEREREGGRGCCSACYEGRREGGDVAVRATGWITKKNTMVFFTNNFVSNTATMSNADDKLALGVAH